jgi:hypothetical protein
VVLSQPRDRRGFAIDLQKLIGGRAQAFRHAVGPCVKLARATVPCCVPTFIRLVRRLCPSFYLFI